MDPIITLTTDFGEGSPYVAAMKGVILGLNPQARVIDLSHRVPPQDLAYADFFLAATVPWFAPGALHVAVVDPGVGSDRALLYVELAGQRLLLPDNGCWSRLERRQAAVPRVRRLDNPRFWRQPVSATFHGRDILAPTAAHLSLGVDPAELGPLVSSWVRRDLPEPVREGPYLVGEVAFVDAFGNLVTNVAADLLAELGPFSVEVCGQAVKRRVRTYFDAPAGELVALVSSFGTLELAVVQGSAAARLGARAGTPVRVRGQG